MWEIKSGASSTTVTVYTIRLKLKNYKSVFYLLWVVNIILNCTLWISPGLSFFLFSCQSDYILALSLLQYTIHLKLKNYIPVFYFLWVVNVHLNRIISISAGLSLFMPEGWHKLLNWHFIVQGCLMNVQSGSDIWGKLHLCMHSCFQTQSIKSK